MQQTWVVGRVFQLRRAMTTRLNLRKNTLALSGWTWTAKCARKDLVLAARWIFLYIFSQVGLEQSTLSCSWDDHDSVRRAGVRVQVQVTKRRRRGLLKRLWNPVVSSCLNVCCRFHH